METKPAGGPPPAASALETAIRRQALVHQLLYLDGLVQELELAKKHGLDQVLEQYRARRALIAFDLGLEDAAKISRQWGFPPEPVRP